MERFLIIYHGAPGGEPEEAEQHPGPWAAWLDSLGSAVLDRGSLSHAAVEVKSRLLGPKSATSTISGYSVIQAEDFNAAVRVAEMCPIFETNGWAEIVRLTTSLG
jgi:hypothetical protein